MHSQQITLNIVIAQYDDLHKILKEWGVLKEIGVLGRSFKVNNVVLLSFIIIF